MRKNLLLLHGALGAESQLEELKQLLSEEFVVQTLNFEGHGGRPSSAPFTMDLFANNVKEHLDMEGINRTHLFGYSMGGYVALTFALEYPHMVEKIITLGTKFEWNPETAKKESAMLNPEIIRQKVPAFAKRLEQLHAPNSWTELLVKTAELLYGLGNGLALKESQLAHLHHEIHICLGELDNMVSKEESENIARQLPNASFHNIPGTKHPIEQVDVTVLRNTISKLLKQ